MAWGLAGGFSPANPNALTTPQRHLDDSIVYRCALLADRPRLIDQSIDYFGEAPHYAGDADDVRDAVLSPSC